jgi:glycosyltransferase involved in cell wall biosynthesis
MPKISVVIITFNEEKNIERCLSSVVDVADEILIVDSFSTDRTKEICKQYNARFIQHKFDGYIEQKNWATSNALYDHVLSLDADEELSEELKNSILQVKDNWTHDGYSFNRLTNYCGKWIKHTSWYPSRKLRLWDRRKGSWDGINPHDKFIMVKGSTEKHVKGDLIHYSFYTISQQVNQINKFTDILAQAYHQRGLKPNYFWHIILHPMWRFVRDYFVKLGFLDGLYGLVVSLNSSFEVYLKYLKLHKIIETEQSEAPFRICFFTSVSSWGVEEKWQFENAMKCLEKGNDPVITASRKSELLEHIRTTKMHHFMLHKYNYLIFNIITILRYVSYLKRHRISTIVVSNPSDVKFVSFCAKMAKIENVVYHKNNIAPIPSTFLNKYYFKHVINQVFINSEKTFYTVIMNNYKLITKEKLSVLDEENNFELPDKFLQKNLQPLTNAISQ